MALPSVVGVLVVAAINTVIAAVAIRFLRVRLDTQWGAVVYAVLFVPVLLLASTLVLGLVIPGGVGREVVVLVGIVFPIGLGAAIDVLWMPAPEEVELPDTT